MKEFGKKIHEVIVDDIIHKINTGELEQDQQLPSNKVLAKEYDTSEVTIRKSVTELKNRGYLESIERVGTFVSSKKNRSEEFYITISKDINFNETPNSYDIDSVYLALSTTDDRHHYIPAVETRKIIYADSIPISYEILSIFFKGSCQEKTMLQAIKLKQRTIYSLLESFNVKKKCEITLKSPDEFIRKKLLIAEDTPTFCFSITYFTLDNAPIAKSVYYVAGNNIQLKGKSIYD